MAKLKTGRHTGALKASRQAHTHMVRNRSVKRQIRSLAKEYTEAAGSKDAAKLKDLLPKVSSAWDKAAKTGAIHWKAAARKKSRLARLAQKAAHAPAPAAAAKA
ncbi:MAG: 30S ribosomal protein S20 [Elusimicrobia bacterium]|nr:30S ribosomal protein S20 [Elusimicrobiota bacterium]